MLKKVAKILFSAWLAMLLLFGNTPMEFIHSFTGHVDTVDTPHKGLAIENKHHHCAFLAFEVTAFNNDYDFPVLHFIKPFSFTQKHTEIAVSYIQRIIVNNSLRGPPSIA